MHFQPKVLTTRQTIQLTSISATRSLMDPRDLLRRNKIATKIKTKAKKATRMASENNSKH